MKHFLWILGVSCVCVACASASQTSGNAADISAESANLKAPVVERVLPPLAQGDIRVEVHEGGAVVDAHCEREHVIVRRVDKNTPEIMFEADADLMGVTENAVGFIEPADINFDGYMDILVPHAIGAHNAYHRAWIWNHELQKYEEIPEFKELGTCSLKPEFKEIHVFTHISAASYTEAVWQIQGKVLVRKLLIAVSPEDEAGNTFAVKITKNDGGQNILSTHSVPENDLSVFIQQAYASNR